jgi:hypothetical protein
MIGSRPYRQGKRLAGCRPRPTRRGYARGGLESRALPLEQTIADVLHGASVLEYRRSGTILSDPFIYDQEVGTQ